MTSTSQSDPELLPFPLLPQEIVENIIRQTEDSTTLVTLMRVSRRIHDVAGARLYGEVVMTAKNAKGLHWGLSSTETETESSNELSVANEGIVGVGNKRKLGINATQKKVPAKGGIASLASYGSDTDSDSDSEDESPTPVSTSTTAISRPRKTKAELLSMIKYLHVYEIPALEVCHDILATVSGTNTNTAQPQGVMNVSIRPNVTWHLIRYYAYKPVDRRRVHPFLRYLRNLPVEHMCIQLPVMDRHVEDTITTDRNHRYPSRSLRPHGHLRTKGDLRNAICDSPDPDDVQCFFNMILPGCGSITFHNLVLSMTGRALGSIVSNTKTVRAFFRPCAGADGDLVDKASSRYCYNHYSPGSFDRGQGLHRVHKLLSRPQNMELIDMDWLRGKYEPERDREVLECTRLEMDLAIETVPESERAGWGTKILKMSNEVETCQCCTRGQLSAVESSIAYGIVD